MRLTLPKGFLSSLKGGGKNFLVAKEGRGGKILLYSPGAFEQVIQEFRASGLARRNPQMARLAIVEAIGSSIVRVPDARGRISLPESLLKANNRTARIAIKT